MIEATWYMGPLGDLRPLPCPEPEIVVNQVRFGGMHQALSGARTMDVTGTRAEYGFDFTWLEPDEFAWLEAMSTRTIPGPYYLLHPMKKNRLSVQATGLVRCFSDPRARGNQFNYAYTTDRPLGLFAPARSVRLNSWVTTNNQVSLRLAPTTLTPIFGSENLTASIYIKSSAATTGTLQLDWYDANTTLISANVDTFNLSTAWQRISMNRDAPSNAAAVRLSYNTRAPRTALTFCAPQLERGPLSSWEAGGAASKVLLDQLTATSPRFPFYNCSMTIMEA